MKQINVVLMFFHGFIGIGALFGGVFAISNPSGIEFGMPATIFLKNSPFDNFLIPGIFLFVVLGLGNIFGIIIRLRKRYHNYYSAGLGFILCMWIIIQCYILDGIHPLHIAFFIFGVIQVILSMIHIYKHKLSFQS